MDLRTISLAIGTVLIARLLHELTEDLRVALRRGFVWETPSVSSQNRPSSCSPCLVDIVSLLRIEYRDQLVHGYTCTRLNPITPISNEQGQTITNFTMA